MFSRIVVIFDVVSYQFGKQLFIFRRFIVCVLIKRTM